jgi:hypothetical protein
MLVRAMPPGSSFSPDVFWYFVHRDWLLLTFTTTVAATAATLFGLQRCWPKPLAQPAVLAATVAAASVAISAAIQVASTTTSLVELINSQMK